MSDMSVYKFTGELTARMMTTVVVESLDDAIDIARARELVLDDPPLWDRTHLTAWVVEGRVKLDVKELVP